MTNNAHDFRELLEQIKDFEEREFSGASRDGDGKVTGRLQPLNESGATSLLQMVGICYCTITLLSIHIYIYIYIYHKY